MFYTPLESSFFLQDTITVAQQLLGKSLIHQTQNGLIGGIIVETEAYLGKNDPASHAYTKETLRNRALFGEPGHAYIYFTYGMYYCFNVSTAPIGVGEGVLIRALEPVAGINFMKHNRPISKDLKSLCNGPAKLVQALGITKELYGVDLLTSDLRICQNKLNTKSDIVITTRIGIKEVQKLPLRFYIKNNIFVSKI